MAARKSLADQQFNELDESRMDNTDTASNHDTTLDPAKRVRSGRRGTSINRRSIQGDAGYTKSLMKMPVEIFAQITSYLNPGDLITLVRSCKTLRSTLLHRSATQMWRQAEINVPGLPRCPSSLSEPQYAALMFSKTCTLCGGSASAKPDAGLHVRLCATCRGTQIVEITKDHEVDIRLLHRAAHLKLSTYKPQTRIQKGSIYCLRQSVQDVLEEQEEILRTRDRQALADWESGRLREVLARKAHSWKVEVYFMSVDSQRAREVEILKQERANFVMERLKVLGWTDEDMKFSGSEAEAWNGFLRVSKPLTDRIWDNLLPKLTPMLEKKRRYRSPEAKMERLLERREQISRYLLDIRSNDPLFEPMLEALGFGKLPGLEVNDSNRERTTQALSARSHIPWAFPRTQTIISWDCLSTLKDVDITGPEMRKALQGRTLKTRRKVLDWRTAIEQQLVKVLQSGGKLCKGDTPLLIKNSSQPAANLPHATRLLLRADTIFETKNTLRGPRMFLNYPRFVSPFDSTFNPHGMLSNLASGEINLSEISRATGVEKIVKLLLKHLGMPDVSYLELFVMGNKFVCRRCPGGSPKQWDEIVAHYVNSFEVWETWKNACFHARHPIVFRNMHDLELAETCIPLVQLLTTEEARRLSEATRPAPDLKDSGCVSCYLCYGSRRICIRLRKEDLFAHMRDVHDVAQPVEVVHYGSNLNDMEPAWLEMWDAYHDALEARAEH